MRIHAIFRVRRIMDAFFELMIKDACYYSRIDVDTKLLIYPSIDTVAKDQTWKDH